MASEDPRTNTCRHGIPRPRCRRCDAAFKALVEKVFPPKEKR